MQLKKPLFLHERAAFGAFTEVTLSLAVARVSYGSVRGLVLFSSKSRGTDCFYRSYLRHWEIIKEKNFIHAMVWWISVSLARKVQ